MLARVSKYNHQRNIQMPVYGAGVDIKSGAMLKVGTTPGTDNGALIKASGSSAIPDIVGILGELHDFSETDDTLIDGTKFVTHPVELAFPSRIITMEFDQDDVITVASNVTTTLTITSLEDDIDAAWIYVVSGLGLGQLQVLTASTTGSATLKAAFNTALDTTSRVIKILPRFHDIISLNADGTKLSNQAAAGSVKALTLDIRMIRPDKDEQLNPTRHAGLRGLDNAPTKFVADVIFRNLAPYTID